jgi:hypothetical protein
MRGGKTDMAAEGAKPPGCGPSDFRLPLVSVIVTAHNYGRFLRAAVASILAQSYGEIEIVIVDDGSTDETAEVVAQLRAETPAIEAIATPRTLGQGAASRLGFKASHGDFIVFMDADDLLEPDFVRDHVFVNLSSRVQVGFTASDIYQVVDGRLITATGEALNTYLRQTPAAPDSAFRTIAAAPAGPWSPEVPEDSLLRGVRYRPPGQTQWIWSPMTANMFRRDALSLFVDHDEFAALRLSTDVFLCTGVSALCGSLLIDKPLSWYRIHGRNHGTFQAQLTNVRAMHAEAEMSEQARTLLVEHFARNARALCVRLWSPQPFVEALCALDRDLAPTDAAPQVAACLDRNRETLIAAVGEAAFAQIWRSRNGAPASTEAEAERPAIRPSSSWWAGLISPRMRGAD